MALFGSANREEILSAISDRKFLMVSYLSIGIYEHWRSALDEYSEIAPTFSNGEIDVIFEMLLQRARSGAIGDRRERLMEISASLGFDLPSRRAHETALRKINMPIAGFDSAKWREDYLAGRLSIKPRPVNPRN